MKKRMPIKLIIAGDRNTTNRLIVLSAFCRFMEGNKDYKVVEIVSGGCRGVDAIGEQIAIDYKLKLTRFPADWDLYGNAAGPIRNKRMAEYADALVAILVPHSKGTKGMIKLAEEHNLLTRVEKHGFLKGDAKAWIKNIYNNLSKKNSEEV